MSYNHDTTSHSEKQVNLVQIAQEVVHNLLQSYSEVQPLDADAEGMFHYVYLTWHKDTYKFYVGKHSSKNPATDSYIGSGKHLLNAVQKHGTEAFEHRILCYLLTSQEALDLEASIVSEQYIKLYRDELRITYNLISGGIGGAGCSEETRQKMSEQGKKRYADNPEARLKNGERFKKWHEENPEARRRIGKEQKKYYAENPEARQKQSGRLKEYYAENPEALLQMSERHKKWYDENPEARLEQGEQRKKYYAENPEARLVVSERVKKHYAENPEARLANSERRKKHYAENPEARLAASERTKKYFAENPEARLSRAEQNRNKPVKLLSPEGAEVEVPKNEVLNYLKQGYFFLVTEIKLYNPSTMEQVLVLMFHKGKCYRVRNTPRVIKLLEEGWLLGKKPKV